MGSQQDDQTGKSQAEKFKKLARDVEADEDEKAFKAKLKKLVKGDNKAPKK